MAGEKILAVDDSPTILRVVQLVLGKAGYEVVTAPDGEDAIEVVRKEKPDLILLDFVMPKMNGLQFCKHLVENDELGKTPVILMSAKGDQVGDRFVQVMGIVDYITKPFSPEAVTAVVSHALAKYEGGLDEEPLLPKDAESVAAAVRLESEARRIALDGLRQGIAKTIDGAEEKSASEALSDSTLEALVAEFRAACPALFDRGEAVLTGDLRMVPLAQVLELLERQRQSGVLTVNRPGAKADAFFRDGKIELAWASGVPEEFWIGRFIVRGQHMTREALDDFLRNKAVAGELLGAQLVREGLITDVVLKRVISEQTSSLVYELLRWNFGRFVFVATRDLPAIANDAGLGLQVDGVLMEGFRRVDEWHLIEKEIDDFDQIFLRNEEAVAQMGKGALTREEMTVLELVNGKNTVRDIIRISRMTSFDVSKMLYRLLSIRLIRKRVMPVAVG